MSGITYATDRWNPCVQCRGCEVEGICWSLNMARRQKYAAEVLAADGKHWSGKSKVFEDRMDEPLRARKPRVYACCFMGDLAHADADTIRRVVGVALVCDEHQFLFLTKWPAMLLEKLRAGRTHTGITRVCVQQTALQGALDGDPNYTPYLGHLWVGISASDQCTYDERVGALCDPETGWRGNCWVSLEPLMESVNLAPWLGERRSYDCPGKHGHAVIPCPMCNDSGTVHSGGIEFVIAGSADSLPHGADRFRREIARRLRDQCAESGVPFWLKQAAWSADYAIGRRVFEAPFLDRLQHLEAPSVIAAILRREGKLP